MPAKPFNTLGLYRNCPALYANLPGFTYLGKKADQKHYLHGEWPGCTHKVTASPPTLTTNNIVLLLKPYQQMRKSTFILMIVYLQVTVPNHNTTQLHLNFVAKGPIAFLETSTSIASVIGWLARNNYECGIVPKSNFKYLNHE